MKKLTALLLVLTLCAACAAAAAEDNPRDVSFLPKLSIPAYTLTLDEETDTGMISSLKFNHINGKNAVYFDVDTPDGWIAIHPKVDGKKHTATVDLHYVHVSSYLFTGQLFSATMMVCREKSPDDVFYYLFPVDVSSDQTSKASNGAVLVYWHADSETGRYWHAFKFENCDTIYIHTAHQDADDDLWFGLTPEGEQVELEEDDPLQAYASRYFMVEAEGKEYVFLNGSVPEAE